MRGIVIGIIAGVLSAGFALSAQTTDRERAEQELKQQKRQRILGVIPNFNTSYVVDAAPLTPGQKFRLSLRSATDPFMFVVAGLDSGIGQATDRFHDYGQGAQGYFKRFGASYADSFNGSIFSTAVFPIVLHQDPRYFRKGTGGFFPRFLYAISTTVRTKNDKHRWVPNYSNVMGNLTAGGISNLYYPASDRGAALTLQRAFTVTAEGALGSIFVEFWPDISEKLFGKH